jgi:hypothetical protein
MDIFTEILRNGVTGAAEKKYHTIATNSKSDKISDRVCVTTTVKTPK